MGMYDTIGSNADQVKCFYVPCFYYSNSSYEQTMMGYMGGSLRHYSKNFDVPTHTLWYKYTDNFIILDTMNSDYEENGSQPVIHVISDRKYKATVSRSEKLLTYIDSSFDVINKYGDAISISRDSIESFVADLDIFVQVHRKIIKGKKYIFDAHSKEKNEFFTYLRNFNKKSELEKDKEYIRLKSIYDDIRKLEDRQVSELSDDFNNKYYPKEDKRKTLLGDIGAYLYCYDLYNGLQSDNEKYIVMYKEFVRRVEENNVSIEEYLEWNRPEWKYISHLKEIWEIMFNKVKRDSHEYS